ncbi:hypothetical protein [Streptomyces doebereineriae]|uniref:Uncharacterized protein n=1 Tax=Streptomyces doebereineriae TaxID=3075528 RepID=A0ABU2VKQ4_9ACTN|nr:hypothetical protein [Streptomyces sp. DSM 41640]MDT0485472.1 hypothetical protein [Streptomyces sp. DSM 41640]
MSHDTDGRPAPPQADRIEDVRDGLRDPTSARDILDLDGHDLCVHDVVRNSPGALELNANLADYAHLPASPRQPPPHSYRMHRRQAPSR